MEIDNYNNDYNKWLELLRNEEDDEKIDEFLNGKEVTLSTNSNSTAINSTLVTIKNGEQPVLKPGGPGIMGCFGRHSVIKGHFGLTQEVLTNEPSLNLNLSNSVVESIARASRLPDVLHFSDLRYHAQSQAYGKDKDYLPINPASDKLAFQQLLFQEIKSAKDAIDNNEMQDFCYHFGFVMHMVQDLACHQGMTNPEHSYLDEQKDHKGESLSPDLSIPAYELARKTTIFTINHHFIEKIRQKSEQLNDFAAQSKITWSKFDKVKNILKLIIGFIEFKTYALEIRTEAHKSRWFNWNVRKIDESLENVKAIIRT